MCVVPFSSLMTIDPIPTAVSVCPPNPAIFSSPCSLRYVKNLDKCGIMSTLQHESRYHSRLFLCVAIERIDTATFALHLYLVVPGVMALGFEKLDVSPLLLLN